MIAAAARRVLWRAVLTATGGVRIDGQLPPGPCVIVANHCSHADTAALLAALPARRRPVVAAAADYWFGRTFRGLVCQLLVGAFPVRRQGGGSGDLTRARAMLAAGRDVIVYPEGTRSRDGTIGQFRSGAARLAQIAGVPLVPVGIAGTRDLLPVHGRLRHARVILHIGQPVPDMTSARRAVAELATHPPPSWPHPDSALRRHVAGFAASDWAVAVVLIWAFAEALVQPLIPEVLLVLLVVAAPRRAPRLALLAALGSVAGGAVMYTLAAHGVTLPAPLTTPLMHTTAAAQVAAHGAAAVQAQPMSGIPYKVYGLAAGQAHTGLTAFLANSILARGLRIFAVTLAAALIGAAARPWRRWYPTFVVTLLFLFAAGLSAVVRSWS